MFSIIIFSSSVERGFNASTNDPFFYIDTDLSVGNIIGSNIFNILVIAGASAAVTGIVVNPEIMRDYVVMIAFSLLLIPIMKSGLSINKFEGGILLGGYIAFAIFLFCSLTT